MVSPAECSESTFKYTARKLALVAGFVVGSIISAAQNQPDTGPPPQAFIPFLTPIGDKARPIWPESFAKDGIQGIVQMLVTIDESGKVTNVEPQAGPIPMRDLAMTSVRTWRFNPVIRNGHAVPAYTTEVIAHYIPGLKPSIGDLKDPEALERQQALKERFPRSNAQILADFEQDSTGRTGRQWVERLTSLAKAAWLAGDLGKADSYANELLARVGELRTPLDRNGAINDGNTVLGLVMLKQGQVDKAKMLLMASANLESTDVILNPRMALVDALLRRGEKAIVLQYFDLCRTHWVDNRDLDRWANEISAGQTPDFGSDATLHP